MADLPGIVEVRNLSFTYPDGTPALEDVSLRVEQDTRVALLGPNGAGKSTLLLHLNGLLQGDGRVTVCGMEVKGRNLPLVRQHVGLVFQDPDDQLFMPTVFDEVAFAALNAGYHKGEVRRRVAAALDAVAMAGHDGKHPANLSLGQRKRVCLAAVLVVENRILVLDEPSSGLDPAGRRSLLALLLSLETTMIVATHDLRFAERLCGR